MKNHKSSIFYTKTGNKQCNNRAKKEAIIELQIIKAFTDKFSTVFNYTVPFAYIGRK
jgi:hypothetical protein